MIYAYGVCCAYGTKVVLRSLLNNLPVVGTPRRPPILATDMTIPKPPLIRWISTICLMALIVVANKIPLEAPKTIPNITNVTNFGDIPMRMQEIPVVSFDKLCKFNADTIFLSMNMP